MTEDVGNPKGAVRLGRMGPPKRFLGEAKAFWIRVGPYIIIQEKELKALFRRLGDVFSFPATNEMTEVFPNVGFGLSVEQEDRIDCIPSRKIEGKT